MNDKWNFSTKATAISIPVDGVLTLPRMPIRLTGRDWMYKRLYGRRRQSGILEHRDH